jgi:hypothetical protein
MAEEKLTVDRIVHFADESGGAWPWRRQLKNLDSTWGKTKYYFDMENHPDAGWLVVFSAWPQTDFVTTIPRERRIFVAGEPESFHVYQAKFLNQFGTVLTTQSTCKHSHAIRSQVGINWFAGVRFQPGPERFYATLDFADFEREVPTKTKLCSVVCSDQTVTKGHRERLAFVNQLKLAFGDQIDFYGRGSRPMPDKDEALAEYTFHIALENSHHKDYWTEKLADPILRGCFPIYSGCTNVAEYFSENSYAIIDSGNPTKSIETIRQILRQGLNADHIHALTQARKKILYEYNIFPVLENIFPKIEEDLMLAHPMKVQEQLFSDHEIKNLKFSRRLRRFIKSIFV